MSQRPSSLFIVLGLASLLSMAQADTTTLYLLNGTVIRGEIVDRSAKEIQMQTVSGVVKVRTAKLMPISRQQLKLPAEVDKDVANSPEMQDVLAQMEKLLAENESLKLEIATLKNQLAKNATPSAPLEPVPPAAGPAPKP